MFKQLLQAEAIDYCQIDACRLGGVNEVLAVLLLAAKFGVPVCPHAGGLGLCEYVQHLSIIDYVCVSGSLDDRTTEFADHLHEHFVHPARRARRPLRACPTAPGLLGRPAARVATPRSRSRTEVGVAPCLTRAHSCRSVAGPPVTRLGLGRAARQHVHARVDDDDARATVDAAWDAGIRYFDTAPLYGHGAVRAAARARAARRGRATSSCSRPRSVGCCAAGAGRAQTIFADVADARSRVRLLRRRRAALDRGEPRAARRSTASTSCSCTTPTTTRRSALARRVPRAAAAARRGRRRTRSGAGMNQAEMLGRFVDRSTSTACCSPAATRCSSSGPHACSTAVRRPWRRRDARRRVQQRRARRSRPRRTSPTTTRRPRRSSSSGRSGSRPSAAELPACRSRAAALQFPLGASRGRRRCSSARARPTRSGERVVRDVDIPAALWDPFRVEGLLDADAPYPCVG